VQITQSMPCANAAIRVHNNTAVHLCLDGLTETRCQSWLFGVARVHLCVHLYIHVC
jgi:hypothetical protein